MLKFFSRNIPFYYVPAAVILSAAIAIIVYKNNESGNSITKQAIANADQAAAVVPCNISTQRLGGYEFVKPLLFVEPGCESGKFANLKSDISAYLDQLKQTGHLSAASVYFKDLNSTDWTGYYPDEKHNPGSLLKVPEMITLLKMEEVHPGFLQKKVQLNQAIPSEKMQSRYLSKTIEEGKTYSVMELMKYMISYSDNNATLLLNSQMDSNSFKRTFTDIGMTAPNLSVPDYAVSAKEYSLFLRALYNASYLTISHSEMATELMSTCDFKDGFNKGLPEKTKLAHKYGMARYNEEHELSESAIIYINNNAYVLTIMTRGKDFDLLPGILQHTCEIIYGKIAGMG